MAVRFDIPLVPHFVYAEGPFGVRVLPEIQEGCKITDIFSTIARNRELALKAPDLQEKWSEYPATMAWASGGITKVQKPTIFVQSLREAETVKGADLRQNWCRQQVLRRVSEGWQRTESFSTIARMAE
uniref:Uncharacterized protein n=1 Tax=Parascaris univalens TaxID=6257 RepID=A0A915CJC0_PARUN